MNAFEKKSSKTIGAGGCGKCRVYYSQKFKRKVVEKTVGESFIRTKKNNRTRFQTLMTNTTSSEILLKKESIFMILTNFNVSTNRSNVYLLNNPIPDDLDLINNKNSINNNCLQ